MNLFCSIFLVPPKPKELQKPTEEPPAPPVEKTVEESETKKDEIPFMDTSSEEEQLETEIESLEKSVVQSEVKVELETDEAKVKEEDGEEIKVDDVSDDSEPDVNEEIYDSDLDPESYDSDLEYDLYNDVTKLSRAVDNEHKRQKSRDGPGHVYVFTDSARDLDVQRVKVGATRALDKKLRQAQSFNPAIQLAFNSAVSHRKGALSSIHMQLRPFRLDTYTDWFQGPIDDIIDTVTIVSEKFGTSTVIGQKESESNC